MNKLYFGFIPITVLAGISLCLVAVNFDPYKSDNLTKILFFASMTAFIWGCGAIVFFMLNFFSNDRPADSLRRGFFFSVFFLFLVILRKNGILYWYTGFGAAVITMLIELWIYKKSKISFTNYPNS